MKKRIIVAASAAGLFLVAAGAGVTYAIGESKDDRLRGDALTRASKAAISEVGPGTVTSAERSDDGGPAYELSVRLQTGGEVDVELDESFAVVWIDGPDGDDDGSAPRPSNSGTTAAQQSAVQAKAEASALAAVGSGRVTEFDRSDHADHVYEVEVTLDDGRDVDVELSADFAVLTLDDVRQ